jgi:D-alanyl-D-alanine carboxypeptidase/D-alanyl-D-alanine-endopeptidase (penicillin-binding protein 4)
MNAGPRSGRKTARVGIAPIIAMILLASIPAVGFGVLWRWADSRVPAATAAETPVTEPELPSILITPVLSVRRAPQILASTASEGALVAALSSVGQFVDDTSCLVVRSGGRTIYDHGGDTPVTPASNEKLITAAVALEVLGPDFTFTTTLLGTVADGAVTGDLYLRGGGDPLLSTADYPASVAKDAPTNITPLETLVNNLVAAGVTHIDGSVIGDDSRYDAERFVPSWSAEIQNTEAGPLGALMVNDATRQLGTTKRYADPSVGAATDLIRLLKTAGITIGGSAKSGPTPAGTPEITNVPSAPLSAIVGEMLTTSDDNTAELLLKELSVHVDNIVGTRADGLDVLNRTLVTWGVDTTRMTIVDGSGLDSSNIVTCNILLQVLEHQPLTGPLGAGLAVAGQTGTLETFFVGTPIAGRLHAKTGTLTNAKALTGYLDTPAGVLDFSLILDSPGIGAGDAYLPIWAALGQAMGAYPSGPAIDTLQPR